MSQKFAEKVEEEVELLPEGEYTTPYGTVHVEKTEDGYRIVIRISKTKLGNMMMQQILGGFAGALQIQRPRPV